MKGFHSSLYWENQREQEKGGKPKRGKTDENHTDAKIVLIKTGKRQREVYVRKHAVKNNGP